MAAYIYQLSADWSPGRWFSLILLDRTHSAPSSPAAAMSCLQTCCEDLTHSMIILVSDLHSSICTCLGPFSHQSSLPPSPLAAPKSHQSAVLKDGILFCTFLYLSGGLTANPPRLPGHSLCLPSLIILMGGACESHRQVPGFSGCTGQLLLLLAQYPSPPS